MYRRIVRIGRILHRTAIGLLAGAVLAGSAGGQIDLLRTDVSPAAPLDLSKPAFNTLEPKYDPTGIGEKNANTVSAEVDGRAITLGDVGDAIRSLPPSVATLSFDSLYTSVLEQLVRREALAIRAQQLALDQDPIVRRRVKAAADQVLGNEMLRRVIGATITETALLERYNRDFAGKPGPDEARVRVIMVPTEDEATALIGELKGGADFAAVARRSSKDTTARAGGDLGFVARTGLNPEIGAVAFSLPTGQINALPVRRAGGWFIVKVEERRTQKTPPFLTVREQLTETLVREGVPAVVERLLADVVVRKYDINGKEPTIEKPASR